MPQKDILALLRGGNRRTLGRANEVARIVSADPRLFPKLVAGLWSEERLVRTRAADAAEKVTRRYPQLLLPCKKELLGLMSEASEPELRWHLAAMMPRLPLNSIERQFVITQLNEYLKDRSSIVKTFALQGLAVFARNDLAMRNHVIEILRNSVKTGTPAMKARSRRLLSELDEE